MQNELKQLNVRVREDVAQQLRELSEQERISMSSLAEKAIKEYVEQKRNGEQ